MLKSTRITFVSILSLVWIAINVQSSIADEKPPELSAPECGGDIACTIGDRSYQVLPPDGWDGKAPLPVLLHFHGWGRTGKGVLRNKRISTATRQKNVLLVAPNGLGRSWSFWGSNDRDIRFALAVMEDVKARFPVDENKLWVSGFSYGSAMAWRLACRAGQHFDAFFPIAGTLWNQDGIDCTAGPISIRHVHGLKDTVMTLPEVKIATPLSESHCGGRSTNAAGHQRKFCRMEKTVAISGTSATPARKYACAPMTADTGFQKTGSPSQSTGPIQ